MDPWVLAQIKLNLVTTVKHSEDWQEGTRMCLLKDHVRKFQDGMQKKQNVSELETQNARHGTCN